MNKIARAWEIVEARHPKPQRVNQIMETSFAEFERNVRKARAGNSQTICAMISSLYAGDAWILRGAFSREWINELRRRCIDWTRSRPSSFHKMVDGVPDFHRMIDADTGKKYAFGLCKHAAYFFRWNDDPLTLWPEITRVWRPIKAVMGLEPTTYEQNLPSDGATDRVQVVRYPPGIGYLEPHQDPSEDQRCYISGYMSKRGRDFEGGGFYFVGKNDEVVDAEEHFEVGDVCIGYATVAHGVAPCDRGKAADWSGTDGRWFLGLYSNSPDTGVPRNQGAPLKLDLPGVMPA